MFYTINEFAKLIGVSPQTLRLWDKQGKLKPHHRTEGNQRVYSSEQADSYLGDPVRDVVITMKGSCVKADPFDDMTTEELKNIQARIMGVMNSREGMI